MTPEQTTKLAEWSEALKQAQEAKPLIENEQRLRKEVMTMFFPEPVEGTNTQPLENGWKLKSTYSLDRKIDPAALPAVLAKLREMGVNPDPLVRINPSLATTEYKALITINPEAAKVFDQALIISPKSPTVELVPPKTK